MATGTARSGTPPLVVFGDDWGRHVSSLQHLFAYVFPYHRTVWVNGIGHRKPGIRDIQRLFEKVSAMVRPRTRRTDAAAMHGPDIVVHPRVLPWHDHRAVRLLNGWSLARAIRAALAELGGGRPVVVTGSPPSACVLGKLKEVASIYFCMDDFAHLPGVSPEMLLPLERLLLEHVDAVVATSRALVASKVPKGGTVHYLPQGVNFEHFATAQPLPADLAALPQPRIGFAGGVGPGLDLDIVHSVAAAFPTASVVLVGPVQAGLGPIAAPNIHRLGRRPYAVLPAYVQGFDVGIIPYVRNPWMDAVDPLKLLEYLAAGIPVVTTDLPEVEKYASVVTIARNRETFVKAVQRALSLDTSGKRAARQEVAAQNTWSSRAENFRSILNEVSRPGRRQSL